VVSFKRITLMRSFMVIVVSAVTATAITLLFVPVDLGSRNEVTEFVVAHWRSVTLPWLAIYGVSALVLNTIVALNRSAKSGNRSARRFLIRLASTQYFTSLIALLAVGLLPFVLEARFPFSLSKDLPELMACGAIFLGGLSGWIVLFAVILPRAPNIAGTGASPELRLLQEIAASLRARPINAEFELTQLSQTIEQGNRRTLELIKELTMAVNQLYRRMREDFGTLKKILAVADPATETLSAAQSAVERTVTELRNAVALLDASLSRVAEATTSIPEQIAPGVASHTAARDSCTRAELTNELRELLQQMPQRTPPC
jgi:hypothetical protein